MNYTIQNGELYHFGVKGMKWGHRKARQVSIGKRVGRAVGNSIKKAADKQNKRNEANKDMGRDYGMLGVGVTAARSVYNYRAKKFIKGLAATTINAAANAYITSGKGGYYSKVGADWARKAAINTLSVSTYVDQVQSMIAVRNAYIGMMEKRVSKAPAKVKTSKGDSAVTKRVKADYNKMSDHEFTKKYQTSKYDYAKRVEKYGDPYMNSPLAKAGKKIDKKSK